MSGWLSGLVRKFCNSFFKMDPMVEQSFKPRQDSENLGAGFLPRRHKGHMI